MVLSNSQDPRSGHARQWIAEARDGSAAALGQIMELCRQYLLLVANRELEPEFSAKGGASDLVQETFLEAHRDFARFEGTTHAEVLAWLRRILLNNLSNFRRRYAASEKRQIRREISLDSTGSQDEAKRSLAVEGSSPSSHVAAKEKSADLDRALEGLPIDYREVILLRHEQGLSFAEVGQLMNRSAEAARKLWARAICLLREELEDR